MHLLNANTLKLETFHDDRIPEYAILSHTWGEDEVSYQDIRSEQSRDLPRFSKIRNCCKQALSDGWQYVWIDTCCIDKSSSAELSESINSMYKWYKKARICYAYLSDVHLEDEGQGDQDALMKSFRGSRWFTRGWTLQELLAPETVIFYSDTWHQFGTSSSLKEEVAEATGIESFYLLNPLVPCVAVKLSWVAHRKTTRKEDIAYCLFGLFDVNMPLLYGEGDKAFMRLQHEISRTTEDESLFAWKDSNLAVSGLFAQHPIAFADSTLIARRLFTTDTKRQRFNIVARGTTTQAISYKGLTQAELEQCHGKPQDGSVECKLANIHNSLKDWVRYCDHGLDDDDLLRMSRRTTAFHILELRCVLENPPVSPVLIYLMKIADNEFARVLPGELLTVTLRALEGSHIVPWKGPDFIPFGYKHNLVTFRALKGAFRARNDSLFIRNLYIPIEKSQSDQKQDPSQDSQSLS